MKTFRDCFVEIIGQHEAKVKERERSGICETGKCDTCEEHKYCKRLRVLVRR